MLNKRQEHHNVIEDFLNDNLKYFQAKVKNQGRTFWLRIGAVAFAIVLVGGFGLLQLLASSQTVTGNKQVKLDSDDIVYVQVKPGMTADNVGDTLLKAKVIDSKFSFWLLAKLNGADSKLKVGTYKLARKMDTKEVLEVLLSGKTSLQVITIPEGFTVNEIARRLEREGIASASEVCTEAKEITPFKYMQGIDGRVIYAAEGFLFPDTYEIEPNESVREILGKMVQNFDERLTPELRLKAAEENISIYQLVTLASLVEKEAMYDEDRAVIAQVLLKRWEISMPLQSDATLQYLMDAPKEDVSLADTKIDSPYNTYQNYGLPPGPVANPGLASIKAVLYPAQTDYLYFVADRQGHNHYSRTYDEHLAEVARVR